MKHILYTIIAASLLGGSNTALATHSASVDNSAIWLGSHSRFSSWRAISEQELIVWATPSRPYLITMSQRNVGLRFADAIALTTTAGRVTRFDNVIVDGQRTPIQSIAALDKQQAKAMHWRSAKDVAQKNL